MVKKTSEKILKKVTSILDRIDEKKVEDFLSEIIKSKTIFVVGAGRSGLVARAFAMRLMHLGFSVYIVGDTVTPSLKKNDLMIAVSGSGKTISVVSSIRTAILHQGRVISITANKNSELAKKSKVYVEMETSINSKNKEKDYTVSQLSGVSVTLTPLGTVFELSSLVFCDAIIAELMTRIGKTESDMKKHHANIE